MSLLARITRIRRTSNNELIGFSDTLFNTVLCYDDVVTRGYSSSSICEICTYRGTRAMRYRVYVKCVWSFVFVWSFLNLIVKQAKSIYDCFHFIRRVTINQRFDPLCGITFAHFLLLVFLFLIINNYAKLLVLFIVDLFCKTWLCILLVQL